MISDLWSAREIFRGRLGPDEDITWYGQPKTSVLFNAHDIFLIPFSLLWGGFALYWEGSVIAALLRGEEKARNGGDLLEFSIFGAVMVLIGLYFVVGRFFGKRWLKRHTHYIVTGERAVVLVAVRTGRILSLDLNDLTALKKSVGQDGVGTIWLGKRSLWTGNQDNTGLEVLGYFLTSRQKPPPVFYDIADADRVYELINDMTRERRNARLGALERR